MQAVVAAPTGQPPETSVRHELVFIDATVPEADKLIQGILATASTSKVIDVVVIQAGEDGLAVITAALQQRHDLDAVHIISHGDSSGLTLGTSRLDSAALASRLGELSSWGQALTADADLLLYGCDLAQTHAGRLLVDNLSLLTGADVAASEDFTGAASLGANWVLEYQHGQIETTVVVEGEAVALWDHVLATLTLQEGTTAGYTDTTDTYLHTTAGIADNTNYGASTTLLAGEDGTGGAAQLLIKFDNLIGTGTNQIPMGSTITGVTLTMQITTRSNFTNPSFDFHRMLTTWTGASTWDSMGGGVSSGSGYSNTVDGTITESGTGSYSITNNANMIASVQAWANNPSSNYGWWTSNGGYSSRIAFGSAENATVANRPKLVVSYTPPIPQSLDLDANNSSGVAGSGYTGAYTEQTPIKIADTDATISGGSTTSLNGMTVTITNPLDGVLESLSATTTGTSIAASYNSGTGVLTLSGTDTLANYQTVLRSITYNNTSDNPNTTSRAIDVVATDTNGTSTNTATTNLTVTRVNDAPTGASTAITTLEDTAYTFSTADFGFADPNDAPADTLLSVKITTLPGAGSLMLNGVAINAGDFILASDIAAGKLVYTPGANGNGAGYANFTFQVQDNGGTTDGGVNLDGTPRTMTVNVTAINDVPTGANTTITTPEDTAYTFGTADFGFADPNDSPANTLLSVKITTLPSAGPLTLNGAVVNAGDVILAIDISAGKLVYTPLANGNGAGYASFTFQVQDNGGTANGGVSLDGTPRTMTMDVTSVNDAPVGTDNTVTTNEDTARTCTVADFGFSDLRDAPGNAFWSVRITTLPGAGTLTLNGAVVNAGDFVLPSDIAAGKLVFTPLAGTGASTSFTFQVRDDGGTALAGTDTDAVARRMSIAVASASASVPQAPSPTNPGTGAGGGSNTGSGTSPATPTQPTQSTEPSTPTAQPKDDAVDQSGDKLDDHPVGSPSPVDNAPLPPVQGSTESDGTGQGTSGQQAPGGAYGTSAANYAANQASGFAFRLEAGGLNIGVTPGNILLEMSVNLVNSSSTAGLNLSFSPVGVQGSEHSAPSLAFTENTEDRRVKVEKMVVQTSGAALSVGAVWWAARMSGLLASLMISTPAWRSIDPLPVMGLGGGRGPDDEEDGDEHGDDPTGMDARAARLFGDNKAGNRELEGIG